MMTSNDEIIRRYYSALCDCRCGNLDEKALNKLEYLMRQSGISSNDRPVVQAALTRSEQTEDQPAVAIQLPDGRIVTGKTSELLGAASAALLNAVKTLCGFEGKVHMIEPSVIEPIQKLKTENLGNRNPRLHPEEVLIALVISAAGSPTARKASEMLSALKGSEAHSTVILSQKDEDIYRRLGINITCEAKYQTKKLFHG